MVGDKPFLGVGFPPLKSVWISMATVEILFWQPCQISWLEGDADHVVLIVLQPLCQQSVMSFIEAAFSNYDMWILRTLPFDLALGVPVRRNKTSARGEGLRDFCHWAPVRPVLDRVIRVSGTTFASLQLSTSLRPTSLDFCRHARFDYSNRLIRLQQALT